MILQALNGYYHRLCESPDQEVARPGYGSQKFSFCLVIDQAGNLVRPVDIRKTEGKRTYQRPLIVPQEMEERSGARIAPHFFWDNTMYVLGNDTKGKAGRSRKAFEAFKALHHELCDEVSDPGIEAVLRFLDGWDPDDAPTLEYWDEMADMNLVFQLEGEKGYIHERPAVREIWRRYLNSPAENDVVAPCLVTGAQRPIARLHPAIKGVRNAQSKGASIVSFNRDAFTSYGKAQSYNAPVSQEAAFAYTTALNHLLRSDSSQKVQIADATTVFWTERASAMEGFMGVILQAGDESGDIQDIRAYLEALSRGKKPVGLEDDPEMDFFILGLAPNASRLSIRFWMTSTVAEVSEKLLAHFADLAIVKRYPNDPDYPGIWQLLRETAALRKSDNIPPLLAGGLMRAILTGAPYPKGLLTCIIARIRADGGINYIRAAIIKGCLVRYHRVNPNATMEVGMTLNTETTNTAYRLGRLFAVLEGAQKTAVPGAGATIKDRYYGSASATPRAVFPQLIRLAQHHLKKIKQNNNGRDWGLEKRIEEICGEIDAFPAHLKMEDQGLFAPGYYHQRARQYQKREDPNSSTPAQKED
jgi:CRISPR-associated protein Csd1